MHKLIAGEPAESTDYTRLNVFLPHPRYARQHFVRILNPAGENVEITKQLLMEAHSLAEKRLQRKRGSENRRLKNQTDLKKGGTAGASPVSLMRGGSTIRLIIDLFR
jgi:hypothetical protein